MVRLEGLMEAFHVLVEEAVVLGQGLDGTQGSAAPSAAASSHPARCSAPRASSTLRRGRWAIGSPPGCHVEQGGLRYRSIIEDD